jgi:hypothetical protein
LVFEDLDLIDDVRDLLPPEYSTSVASPVKLRGGNIVTIESFLLDSDKAILVAFLLAKDAIFSE